MADLEGLKAAQEQVIAALNRRDLDGWLALMHEDVIYLNAVASFAVEGKVALRQIAEALFETCESLNVTLIDTHYRVFERTGIVWGYSALSIKPKEGSPQTILTRANGVYAKVNGKWLLMALHLSRGPSLWQKGREQPLETVSTEENFFKEVERRVDRTHPGNGYGPGERLL